MSRFRPAFRTPSLVRRAPSPSRLASLGLVPLLLALLPVAARGQVAEARGPTIERGPLRITPVVFERNDETPIPAPERVDAEEGHLRVPVRHGIPGPDSLEIHFVRFPSTSDRPGPPIVYLAGGPGGSGTLSAAGDRFGLFHALRELGDVIALDQRGTYGADPYPVCPGSWSYPLDEPARVDRLSEALEPFLEECWQAWSERIDLAAFNSVESADDLDDLREALGAERIVVWGISYGTHLGLAYIRRHPDRVARAILAGVEGPDHTYKLPSNLDRVLLRVDSAMKADLAAREAIPDFAGSLRRLLERLEREPARVALVSDGTGDTVTVAVGALDVQRAVFGALGEREDIVEIVRDAAPVLAGDFSRLAAGLRDERVGNRVLAMSLSMDCASGASAARLARIADEARTALLDDVGNLLLRAACPHWPVPDLGDEFRAPLRSDVPTLFISGTLDARTPPSNAEEIAEGFERTHHLVIEGGSHDDDLFLSSPVIVETIRGFLRGESDLPDRASLAPLRFERP